MTRENSSSKFFVLLRGNLKRHAPLAVLAFIGMFAVLPMMQVLQLQNFTHGVSGEEDIYRAYAKNAVTEVLIQQYFAVVVLVILAVVGGITVFRFLHDRRQSDFFFALPISRKKLFAVNITTVFVAVIPAYLLNILLACVICAASGLIGVLSPMELLKSTFIALVLFLIVFAISALSAVLCGNTIVSLLLCGWLQVGLAAAYALVRYTLYLFYPVNSNLPDINLRLSPMLGGIASLFGNGVDDTGIQVTLVYLGIGLVILVLTAVLFAIRRAETAESAIAFPMIQAPLKYFMVTVLGLAVGILFYSITMNMSMQYLGMIFGVILCSGVTEIVYNLDFHSMFRHMRGLAVYAVIAVIAIVCMANDVTGYNTRLPERSRVVSAELANNYDNAKWSCDQQYEVFQSEWYLSQERDELQALNQALGVLETPDENEFRAFKQGSLGEQLNSLEQAKPFEDPENVDAIYQVAQLGVQNVSSQMDALRRNYSEGGNANSVTVRLTLQNGATIERRYFIPADEQQMNEIAERVRFSKEYLTTRTTIASLDKSKDTNISLIAVKNYINVDNSTGTLISNAAQIHQVLNVLQAESEQLTADYCRDHAPVLLLHTVVGTKPTDAYLFGAKTGYTKYDLGFTGKNMQNVPIYACETKTLKLLKTYLGDAYTTRWAGAAVCVKADVNAVVKETTSADDVITSYETIKTYTDKKTLGTLFDNAIPIQIREYADPVLDTDGEVDFTLRVKGTEDAIVVYCTYLTGERPERVPHIAE